MLDDRQGRLAHCRRVDGIGEHRLLGRIYADRYDLDVSRIDVNGLPQPILQIGGGHRARRLRRDLGRAACVGMKLFEGRGRV